MNGNINVTINGKTTTVSKGTSLSDILDIEKLCGGRGTCGKCKVKVNGKETLACKYIIESDITVETYGKSQIISESGTVESGHLTENICLVLDIGTTTLALAIVSIDEKKAVKVITATNPQRIFGADIITRIDHCRRNSVKELHETLITQVNQMIAELEVTAYTMYVSANVTMLHTFFGVDCSSIGVSPYTPVFLEGKKESAHTIGRNKRCNRCYFTSFHILVRRRRYSCRS